MTTLEVWNSVNGTKVADLNTSDDGPITASVTRRLNEAGTGKVTVLRDHTNADELTYRRCVRAFDTGGTHVGTFHITNLDDVVIDSDEDSGQRVTASGAGLLDRWKDAAVLPWRPLDEKPLSRTRVFNFASPDIDTTPFDATIYNQPRTSLLWGDDRPVAWPDPYASWIWTIVDTDPHPAGNVYFRRDFTLAADSDVAIFYSGDDNFEVWLDGVQLEVEEQPYPQDIWWWCYRAGVHLTTGTHTIAARVENLSSAGPGGFILSAWKAAAGTGIGDLILLTGETAAEPVGTWLADDYPASAPGFTAGAIVRILLEEAQARGALTGWTLDFSDSVDSAGTTWPNIPEFSRPVGSSLFDALMALVDAWVDVDVNLAGLELQMWDKTAGQGSASGVSLTSGTNLTELVRSGSV